MTDVNPERLRDAMHSLAGDVRSVDLRDRALRTSHRLAVRRTVVTAAAAVVALGAVGAGLATVLPRDRGLPGPGTSVHPTEPAPETTSPAPETPTPSAPASPSTGLQAARFPGTLFVSHAVSMDPQSLQQVIEAYAWHSDGSLTRLGRISTDINGHLSISSDGKQVSWFDKGEDLMVSAIDGSKRRVLVPKAGAHCSSGNAAWSPDGRTLAYTKTFLSGGVLVHNVVVVDVATGSQRVVDADGACQPVWSTDGGYLGYAKGSSNGSRIVTVRPDGTGRRVSPLIAGNTGWAWLTSLSAGAQRATAYLIPKRYDLGDPYPTFMANATVDLASGRTAPLAPGVEQAYWAAYTPDGRLLLAIALGMGGPLRLELRSSDGKVLAQRASDKDLTFRFGAYLPD
jgi:TolB protein